MGERVARADRRLIWLVLAIGCVAGVSTYLVTPIAQPDQVMLASDVYRHAVRSWLAGDGLYTVAPPDHGGYTFLYPPLTILVFLPHALLPGPSAAFAVQTLANVVVAIGIAGIVERGLRHRGVDVRRGDRVALVSFMLLSSYSAIQLLNGQITLWLGFAIAVGFDLWDRHHRTLAGVAFAIAALFKVFPAILGLWLLRTRSWRGVIAATATGVTGLVLGAILFGPELSETYLLEVLPGRFSGSTYAGRPDPTDNVDGIHRQLAALWPGGSDRAHTSIAFAVVAPLTALCARRVRTPMHRDTAALGILVGILLFLPLQPLYFPLLVFPLLILCYTLPSSRARALLLLGMVLSLMHLDQESIILGFRAVDAPASVVDPVIAVTEPVFTFVLPPTLGLWTMLLACILVQVGADRPTPAGHHSRGTSS